MVGSYLTADRAAARRGGSGVRRVGGVLCLVAPGTPEPFLNRALGVGTIAAADPALLGRIERLYASAGMPSRVAIATGHVPLATIRLLERRGYVPATDHDVQVYVFDRARPPAVPAVPGLSIERVRPADARLYARTSFESFRERGPRFGGVIEALVRSRRRWIRAYLGRVDGEPAATGMLSDVGPVGVLGNGSVLPRFRGRGLQAAMIAHRIRDGWERGYRLFFAETENPVSAHNMEDLGWRKLYDEVDWERPTAGARGRA